MLYLQNGSQMIVLQIEQRFFPDFQSLFPLKKNSKTPRKMQNFARYFGPFYGIVFANFFSKNKTYVKVSVEFALPYNTNRDFCGYRDFLHAIVIFYIPRKIGILSSSSTFLRLHTTTSDIMFIIYPSILIISRDIAIAFGIV